MAAEKRVAITDELQEKIQDWAEVTSLRQHEVLSWLISLGEAHLAETRPDALKAYERLQEFKASGKIKVAI